MKFMRVLALLCMLGFIAVGSFVAVPAQAIDLKSLWGKKQAPIDMRSIYPIQNDTDFENNAKSHHATPNNDPQIEFEIMTPKDWVNEETPGSHSKGPGKLISDIALYRSPVISAMTATVTIQSVKLQQEISAKNWLKNYILSNKYNIPNDPKYLTPEGNAIKSFREKYGIPQDEGIKAFSDRRAGAECIGWNLDGSNSYMYVTVQFNGNNAVIVRFDSPLPLEYPLRYIRRKVIDSFKFILETDQPIEPLKSFNFSTALKFRYPESLVVKQVDVGDTRNMSANFYNEAKEGVIDKAKGKVISPIRGVMRFVVVRRSRSTSLKKEADAMKDFVTKTLGLEFRKTVSSERAADRIPISNRFIFSRYEVYKVVPRKTNPIPQEIRFVALGDKNWYVLGLLFSPSDNEDFYNWAVNTQEFDMMIKDFR